MTISVLLFASYADALGRSAVDVELPDGSTVADLVASLQRLPGAHRLPPRPMVAVNEEYARWDQAISSRDEVAIIPPVAGG